VDTGQALAGLFGQRAAGGTFAGDPRDPLSHISPELQTLLKQPERSIARVIGNAGAIGAAAFGVVSGIRQGGAQGTTQAIASGLGAASLIPGPQQPFVAAAALITGFVSSLIGSSSEEFHRKVNEQLERNRFAPGPSLERDFDISGREVDFGRTGEVRTIVVQDNRQFHVSAIDARSLRERGPELLDAVMPGIQAGHPVVAELREQFHGR
jgi:hypothetical protein